MAGSPFVEATLSKWTMKEIEDEGMATQFGYASRHEVRIGGDMVHIWRGIVARGAWYSGRVARGVHSILGRVGCTPTG